MLGMFECHIKLRRQRRPQFIRLCYLLLLLSAIAELIHFNAVKTYVQFVYKREITSRKMFLYSRTLKVAAQFLQLISFGIYGPQK